MRVLQPTSPSFLFFGAHDEPFLRLYQLWDENADQAVIFTINPEHGGGSEPLFTSTQDRIVDATDQIDTATYERIGTQRSIPGPPMPTGKFRLRVAPTAFYEVEDGVLSIPTEDVALLTIGNPDSE